MIPVRRARVQQVPAHQIIATKTRKRKSKVVTCRKTIDKYLENASLHGLRYIGDRSLTWFER